MPIAFLAALLGSVTLHGIALFGTELDLVGAPEPLPLVAELRPLPLTRLPAVPASKPVAKAPPKTHPARPKQLAVFPEAALPASAETNVDQVPTATEIPEKIESTAERIAVPEPAAAPVKPRLPASGVIRYAVIKSSLGLQVGRVEQRWDFAEDGSYRLQGITETTGLAALLKPVRVEQQSIGRLLASGLQPEQFKTLKNGHDANENAEFDWSTAEVRLSRDGSIRPVSPGTQDALSLNYQLAFLGRLAEGKTLGVVTGKKYDRYQLDSLGEEEIELPAGRFQTLHLRVQTDNTLEIWIAIEHENLPVKIRFTDKKGESFEQVATELGM